MTKTPKLNSLLKALPGFESRVAETVAEQLAAGNTAKAASVLSCFALFKRALHRVDPEHSPGETA